VASDVVGAVRRVLGDRRDVRLALVFGSVARGASREDSDVDIAVDAPGVDRLALARDISLAIDREVDVVDLGTAAIRCSLPS
jgi:predicted nucleotidyltransferase